ncbi:hypothetical protein [Gracilibacillus sp. YIM 98692]|uniref:hypothetical protein n=1 Tax=Gracilibacillus sp. YIM 98692 TaxID=2663532 RepID=UPI0013CF5D7D|nr:hypothetical protein [Gracilibacillus sp. YIM 98692]
MSIITKSELMEYTHNKLESHFQNNDDFNREFIIMFQFYFNKLGEIILEKELEQLEESLFSITKSQYFNGYFIVQEFLNNEEIGVMKDEWLKQHHGFITEQIPDIIYNLTGEELEEIITTEEMHIFIMDMVTKYENIRPLLKQIGLDVAYLGAKQAFLDEREKRHLDEEPVLDTGLLANIGTYEFITPQHYLAADHLSQNAETWLLGYWSSIEDREPQAGEVTIIRVPREDTTEYIIRMYVSNDILEHERQMIAQIMIAMVMERNNVNRDHIHASFASVENFYVMVQE